MGRSAASAYSSATSGPVCRVDRTSGPGHRPVPSGLAKADMLVRTERDTGPASPPTRRLQPVGSTFRLSRTSMSAFASPGKPEGRAGNAPTAARPIQPPAPEGHRKCYSRALWRAGDAWPPERNQRSSGTPMTRTQIALCALLLGFAAQAGAYHGRGTRREEHRGPRRRCRARRGEERAAQWPARSSTPGSSRSASSRRASDPDSIREEATLQGLTQVESYDGKEGWKIDPFQGRKDPERTSADDWKGLIESAQIGGPLEDYKARGATLEYAGTEDIDGTAAHKLKLDAEERRRAVRVPRPGPLPRDPHREPAQCARRQADGDHRPRRVREGRRRVLGDRASPVGRKGDSSPAKIIYDKVEVNIPLDAGYFSFPAAATN